MLEGAKESHRERKEESGGKNTATHDALEQRANDHRCQVFLHTVRGEQRRKLLDSLGRRVKLCSKVGHSHESVPESFVNQLERANLLHGAVDSATVRAVHAPATTTEEWIRERALSTHRNQLIYQ